MAATHVTHTALHLGASVPRRSLCLLAHPDRMALCKLPSRSWRALVCSTACSRPLYPTRSSHCCQRLSRERPRIHRVLSAPPRIQQRQGRQCQYPNQISAVKSDSDFVAFTTFAPRNGPCPERPKAQTTIDEEEIKKFSAMAQLWWDEGGEFEALHTMNELRVPVVRDALLQQPPSTPPVPGAGPLNGYMVLDVGSGGGILSEPLARLGAFMIGVDASEDNVKIAQAHIMHDPAVAQNIKYIHASVEDLLCTEEETFDAVVASEVVEHVADKSTFVESCCKLVKPGGSVIFTTINKTYLSYVLGVMVAERVLGLVSPGTHDWEKFVPPRDLEFILERNGFSTRLLHGMLYNPLSKRWSWTTDTSINYAIHAVKTSLSQTESEPGSSTEPKQAPQQHTDS